MASSKRGWPTYDSPAPKYLAALALIVLNYNEFEFRIFELFLMHVTMLPGSARETRRIYLEMTDRKRLDYFKMIIHITEKDKAVRDYTFKLLKYFDRCAQIRNLFAHSRYAPSFFGDDNKRLYLRQTTISNIEKTCLSKTVASKNPQLGGSNSTRCLFSS